MKVGQFEVIKRTFEAKKHPKGSAERKRLNEDNVTSEYMTSYKYAVKGKNLSSSRRTKQEAIEWAEQLSKGRMADGGNIDYERGKNYRVKDVSKDIYDRYNLSDFPNFSKTGSISGMKKQYYGKDALLVRHGNYIYNVTSNPEIYFHEAFANGGEIGKKYILTGYSGNIVEDDYEEGEMNETYHDFDVEQTETFTSKGDLIKGMNEIMSVDYSENEFDWESGEGKSIQTDVLVSFDARGDFFPADKREKELWKKGDKKLYNAHYWFHVKPVFEAEEYGSGGAVKHSWGNKYLDIIFGNNA